MCFGQGLGAEFQGHADLLQGGLAQFRVREGYGAEDRGVYLAAYNQWDVFPKQRSKPVHLEEGKEYYIEAAHKQYHSIDHLQLAWQMPGGVRELISGEYMSSFGGDLADRDDDDLPDDWETQYGVDPDDNGGKDFGNGAWGDPYHTGITNREAYLLGWNPSKPSLPDFGDVVTDVPVTEGTPVMGDWIPSGTGAISTMGRVTVNYTIQIPSDGRFLLEIQATPIGEILSVESIEIAISVNGQSLGTQSLRSLKGATGTLLFLLPELKAGSHNLTLTLKNKDLRRSFQINSLRVLNPGGSSSDDCGIPDWLHDYISSNNAITNCPRTSLTSPVCLEGKARALHLTHLFSGSKEIPLYPSSGKNWFGNVDLPSDGSELSLRTTFESGAHAAEAKVSWEVCDINLHPSAKIRAGDSLRLTIGGNTSSESGETNRPLTIKVGEKTYNTAIGTPVVHCFDTTGIHQVTASWTAEDGTTLQSRMDVSVVGVELGNAYDLIVGRNRTITLEGLPNELLLQNEPPLRVDFYQENSSPGLKKMDISSTKGGAQYLTARLGETGPIVDTLAFIAHDNTTSSSLSRIEVIEEYPDGSSLLCFYLASDSLPAGGYVSVRILTAGVQFMDGGSEKRLTSEDFGPDGLSRIMMTAPRGTSTSVCHIVRYYTAQGEEL